MEWMHGPPDVACPVPVAVVPLGSGTVGVEELPTLPATSVVEMGGVGYVGKALLAHKASGATLVTAGVGRPITFDHGRSALIMQTSRQHYRSTEILDMVRSCWHGRI